MANEFFTILTATGRNKLAAATATGAPLTLTQMAVGDGDNGAYYNPVESQATLKHETWRGTLNNLSVDASNPNWIVAELVIPDTVGGFYIREVGLFDSTGALIAVGKFPESYKPTLVAGSNKQLYVRMILEVSNASAVTLLIDPSVVLATRATVDQRIAEELAKLDDKPSVKVATTAAIALTGLQTIDGVALVAGDRVLVKDQAAAKDNGIYVAAAGAWARAADADASIEVTPGLFVAVEQGTANADSIWQLVTDAPITLGTTGLAFEMFVGKTGVAAGTYRSVTVNQRGQVMGGTNPTTLAGYGITDALPATQKGAASGIASLDAQGKLPISQLPALHVPVRQSVLSGVVDSSGRASFISSGSGLACNLSATAAALTLAFAAGFGAAGPIDYVERLTADVAGYWPGLAANNQSYLTITRTAEGVLAAGSALAPVQYSYAYDQTRQALLHFDGVAGGTTMLDDFGNAWTVYGGAKLQSNWSKFGGTALGGSGANNALNGSTDYIRNASFTGFGNGSWAMRCYAYPTSLAAAINYVFCSLNALSGAGGFGVELNITSAGKTSLYLSSTASTWDIANGTTGAATLTANTAYFLELTFDAVNGKYCVYVNGALDQAVTSSARICPVIQMTIGMCNTGYFTGYIDEFEFLPYCDHPNGTAYAVPVAAKSISTPGYASDWFDLSSFTMKSPSAPSAAAGSLPTFATSNKLYVGEAITTAASVSSVVNYAYQGRFDSGLFAVAGSTDYAKTHNLGVGNYDLVIHQADDAAGTAERQAMPYTYTTSQIGWYAKTSSRNAVTISTASYVGHNQTGNAVSSGYYRIRANRGW